MEFGDKNTFEPLALNCAVEDMKDVENNSGKLTVIVTYYTRYKSIDKIPLLLTFGLGKRFSVNAIVRKPTLKEWKGCINFARDVLTVKELRLLFDMEYTNDDAGLPPGVIFYSTGFVYLKTEY